MYGCFVERAFCMWAMMKEASSTARTFTSTILEHSLIYSILFSLIYLFCSTTTKKNTIFFLLVDLYMRCDRCFRFGCIFSQQPKAENRIVDLN